MPRYEKDGRSIETSLPREGVQLRAEGWRELKARTTAVREADAERAETTARDEGPAHNEPVVETQSNPEPEKGGSRKSRK